MTRQRIPDYMSVGEVAQLIGISERTVWRWIESGKLASVDFGRLVRVSRQALIGCLQRAKRLRKEKRKANHKSLPAQQSVRPRK